jgi:hypothetical protein
MHASRHRLASERDELLERARSAWAWMGLPRIGRPCCPPRSIDAAACRTGWMVAHLGIRDDLATLRVWSRSATDLAHQPNGPCLCVAGHHCRLGLVSVCRRRRVRSSSHKRTLAADERLVRSTVRTRCVSADRAALAKLRSSEGLGRTTVRRSIIADRPGSYCTGRLASAEPVIVPLFHPPTGGRLTAKFPQEGRRRVAARIVEIARKLKSGRLPPERPVSMPRDGRRRRAPCKIHQLALLHVMARQMAAP